MREIETLIKSAKKEIIFLDGISQRFLNHQFYLALADSLERNANLSATFICKSDQQIFARACYQERSVTPDCHRTYKGLIARKEEIKQLPDLISQHAQPDLRNAVRARISVKELFLPVFLVIAKIDNKIFLTIPSHRRHSRSLCIRVTEQDDPFYRLASEYLEFIRDDNHGAAYVAEPEREIHPAYDEKGRFQLALPRRCIAEVGLTTRCVFGFVIDSKGKVLLHRRGPAAADNRGLWDKSFGGHLDVGIDDHSFDTAARELLEELIGEDKPSPQIYDGGSLDTLEVTGPKPVPKAIVLAKIRSNTRLLSYRVGPNDENLKRSFLVDVYAGYVTQVPGFRETAETSGLRWVDLSELPTVVNKGPDEFTWDLREMVKAGICQDLGRLRRAFAKN